MAVAVMIAGLVVALASCGDPGAVGTAASTTAPRSTTAAPTVGADGPTGFYVPGNLPDGWSISFSHVTNPWRGACPCAWWMWKADGGATIAAFTGQPREPTPDLPAGIVDEEQRRAIPGGHVEDHGGQVTAYWSAGGLQRGLETRGVDVDVVEELARRWSGDGAPHVPDDFGPTWSGTTPDVARVTELHWYLHTPDDRSMVVVISPWMTDGTGDPAGRFAGDERVDLSKSGRVLWRDPLWSQPHHQGWWPGGADVTVAGSYGEFNYQGTFLSADEMLDVADGFRAVTAAEWTAYVEHEIGPAAAEICRPVLLGDRLADLRPTAGTPGTDDDDRRERCYRAVEDADQARERAGGEDGS